jgi:hypothetical protein
MEINNHPVTATVKRTSNHNKKDVASRKSKTGQAFQTTLTREKL